MKPGWYSLPQSPENAAYFDGEEWGAPTDVQMLTLEHRASITILPATPPPPPPTVPPVLKAKPGTGWWWGISAGATMILIGIIYGFQPAGSYCGAPFKDSNMAGYMDAFAPEYGYVTDYADDCVADLASATATTWIIIGLGILVTLVSALIMATIRSGSSRGSAATPVAQSMASKIEDLARLRDQGLVTAEEYEWKRQELLRS